MNTAEGLKHSLDGWTLTDKIFYEWWAGLDAEARDEFTHLYLGDKVLARFVCVLDYIIFQNMMATDESAFSQLAYSIAAKVPIDAPNLEMLAKNAWRHDAVQALTDRLHDRWRRQKGAEVASRQTQLIEALQTKLGKSEKGKKSLTNALNAVTRYLRLSDGQKVRMQSKRIERELRRGNGQSEQHDNGSIDLLALLKANSENLPAKIRDALNNAE